MALAQGLMPRSNASNLTQYTVAAGQKFLGRPAQEPPAEVLKGLVAYFEKIPELRGAYLFQMADQSVSSTVVGLQFDAQPNAERMQQVMLGIGPLVRGAIPAEASIDFMPLTPGVFLDNVQKCGKALLKR